MMDILIISVEIFYCILQWMTSTFKDLGTLFIVTEASKLLTLFPSSSKWVKLSVMRYCGGAMISHTQFLLLG